MKNIIFYKSNTGFTKQYVDMLQNRIVPLEVYKVEKINKKLLEGADNVFFSFSLRNNVILCLSKFLKKYKYMKDKNIYVIATGIQPPDDEKRDLVITTNSLDEYHVRLFLLLGGLDINKMKPLTKMMMKISIKMAIKKDPSQKEMLEQRLNGSLNFVSNSNLDRLVDIYRRVNLRH